MPGADYSLLLRSLGLDPTTLKLDTGGTLAPSGSTSATSEGLPRITVSTSADAQADLTVQRTLGTGGMGEVMLAVQRALGREVALKRLRPDHKGTAAELLQEALVTGRLEHPNIVPVHMLAVAQDGSPVFVMKRIEGTPWRKLLKDSAALERLSREHTEPLILHLEIFLAVCDAVAFAHSRGVLHRDLKPDNVMVGAFGEVYVLDWGIAVGLTAETGLPLARDITQVTGTPAYMAPEMAAADGKTLGPRSDVFLLGAMLFELFEGRPPHEGADPLDTLERAWRWNGAPEVLHAPEGMREVLRRAMARNADERFESVDALRAAVVQFMRHRDAVMLADEAKARAAKLQELLAATTPADDVAVHQLFSEARFGFSQAVRLWPDFAGAQRGFDDVTVSMVHHELKHERPAAARALLTQLSAPGVELTRAIETVEARIADRQGRLDALERDLDLDRAVAMRAVMAFVQGVVCGAFIVVMGVLTRRGLLTFAHKEAFIGLCAFAFVHLVIVDRALRRRLNQAGLKALNANAVALLGFVAFWAAAWAMELPFHTAVVEFMVLIAVGWGLIATLFDARTGVVAVTYALGAAGVWAFPAAMFEVFGGATVAAFGLLALAWRRARPRFAQT
jgi:serine/threonine-protein kinase